MGKFIENFVKKNNEFANSDAMLAYVEPFNVERIFDVRYSSNSRLAFDLYRPVSYKGLLPVVIDVHGGGWYGGRKENNKAFAMELAKKGFAVFVPSYTLVSEGDLRLQIRELCSFLNWYELHYGEYDCDYSKTCICGDSAGGQLASTLLNISLNKRLAEYFGVNLSVKFVGACFIGGVLYMGKMARKPLMSLFFKAILGKKYRSSRIVDYVNFVDNVAVECPPIYLVTSEQDFMKRDSLKASVELKAKGIKCELMNWAKPVDRKRKLVHDFNILYPNLNESAATNTAIATFFAACVKG